MKKLQAVVEFAEHNLTAYLRDLDGIIGVGETLDDVKESLEKSIEMTKEDCNEENYELPEELSGEYEIEYQFDLCSFLQSYGDVLSKSGLERLTGINQKQLWHYANGKSKPRKDTVAKLSNSIHAFGRELLDAQFV